VVLPGVSQRFLTTAAALDRKPLPSDDPSVEQALDWLLTTEQPA